MKQPQLGKKLTELRKKKGLTQEELVDICNISVRTIQRIESGEVVPRTSTLKIILAALDEPFDNLVKENASTHDGSYLKLGEKLQSFLLLDFDQNKNIKATKDIIHYAWLAGVVHICLGLIVSAVDFIYGNNFFSFFAIWPYIGLKIITFTALIFLQRGIIVLGAIYNNYLLKITSYIIIIHEFIHALYDITTVFYTSIEKQQVESGVAISIGIILIIYGVAFLRLKKDIGRIAKYAGVFYILSGAFLLSLLLALIGVILIIPAEIFEIIILYKTYELIQKRKGNIL